MGNTEPVLYDVIVIIPFQIDCIYVYVFLSPYRYRPIRRRYRNTIGQHTFIVHARDLSDIIYVYISIGSRQIIPKPYA